MVVLLAKYITKLVVPNRCSSVIPLCHKKFYKVLKSSKVL